VFHVLDSFPWAGDPARFFSNDSFNQSGKPLQAEACINGDKGQVKHGSTLYR